MHELLAELIASSKAKLKELTIVWSAPSYLPRNKLKTLQLHCSLRTLPLDPHFPLRLEDPRLPLRPD